ncbi:sugar ABC transporter ATP-binding protein [Paenibacillus tundrae]|uniref:Autoinducer 2 import ATP-binding protein LsrA n=1 Tax=Paenibacillus tundrae TaxID=528187 RepID=A0ABT9W7F1_9BACL|nr:sugar ABC transporter ATP-binding protein [Paenibacillus tundrae]MDQ0169070.1 simple sugar transport system ATP-binding protein [Paenibacillus tundrae]
MTTASILLTMEHIHKQFAGVPALKDVNFAVKGGEIHALLGANGAGKSTLMKILSGAYPLDQGTINLNGQILRLNSPGDAKSQGIHCVYQEVDAALVPQLTAAENIMLDQLASSAGGWWKSPRKLQQRASEVLRQLGADISVHKKVADLTLAEKQMILLARILVQEAKVIIFDEPTAPLSQEETDAFFRIVHLLKDRGVACIFITHRLVEVTSHCDRVTVMRDGQHVFTGDTNGLTINDLVTQMLGKSFDEEFPKIEAPVGDLLLEARGLRRGLKVRGVDLSVHRGEVLAVVGLVGAGKTECSRLLIGADRLEAGEIRLNNNKLRMAEPADAAAVGIVSVPEERRKQGVLIHENVERNLSLPLLSRLSRLGFVSRKRERENAESLIQQLGIKTSSVRQEVKYLSGGNQQKVAIGKWLNAEADVFIFDEPTKGVDIGAKSDIFRIINQLALAGKAVIYFTCELDEGLGIGDRIAVMCEGEIVKEFKRGETNQEQLLYYASGGQEVQA